MGAVIADVLTGRVSPAVASAAAKAGMAMLKVAELQLRLTGSQSMPLARRRR